MDSGDNASRSSVSKFQPTERQQAAEQLLQQGQRHTLLVGGSRSGKTTLLVHRIACRAVGAGNSRHAILRLRANAARASIGLDTLPKVFRLWLPGQQLKHHRADGYFSLDNGSEIWLAGLDDPARVDKILGKEYATIFLNECSQIPYSSVLVALTRLAQVVGDLKQVAYYDLNPVGKGHWTNMLFGDKRDPVSRQPLARPNDYERMFINPTDNAANLTEDYLESLKNLPERQRKRFFEGAYIDDMDGALFSYEVIAGARVDELAPGRRRRIVVAVDPSGASSSDDERADDIGIVVVAKGDDGHAYVLADRSLRDAPAVWGRAAVQAYHEFDADLIVAEENFGGEMVRFVILAADANVKVQVISASRGKMLRAEPVSALYERGVVHHVGRFAVLEDQLCGFSTVGYRGEGSPDHADALVFAVTELLLKDNAPIIEFYRRQADQRRDAEPQQSDSASAPPMDGGTQVAASGLVRLRAAGEVSLVHGQSGAGYIVGADRIVTVKEDDAAPLIAAGFVRVAE